ncbi:hypothetical protein [Heliothis virescens ascovirus 3j]|uniref:Thioredoxin domain-containing protein n=1 Tax=Heliothis virescens ascovirus 3j TaxID=1561067 RepID=A0A2Z5V6Z0_9VIRU|nr:hypothetical protein [Heliothis virescens ascovirus 3j]
MMDHVFTLTPSDVTVRRGILSIRRIDHVPSAVVKFYSPSCGACEHVKSPYANAARRYASDSLMYFECDLSIRGSEELVRASLKTNTPLEGVPEFVLFHYGNAVKTLDRNYVLNDPPARFFPAETHVEVKLQLSDWNDNVTTIKKSKTMPHAKSYSAYRTLGDM